MYNNGQRKGMMYGGGATPRKPMMMGGLAQQNRKKTTAQSAEMSPMGGMTEQKRFTMGMMSGGQIKLDMNKDGKISGKDFKMMGKK